MISKSFDDPTFELKCHQVLFYNLYCTPQLCIHTYAHGSVFFMRQRQIDNLTDSVFHLLVYLLLQKSDVITTVKKSLDSSSIVQCACLSTVL